MGEIVTKEDYWQIILNDPSKIGQITTDDEKFNKVADFTYTVVQNTLLTTEDEDYLKKYEEMIDISGEGLTPFQRKVNILYMLSGKNYIPLNLVRRGLINLGVSAFDVEYIKEENKLVIHTDRVSDETTKRVSDLLQSIHSTLPQFIEVVRYNHNMEISWREINKYAECVTIDDMLAVNPDYKNDFTSDGEWIYPLTKMEVCSDRNAKPAWYLFEGVNQRRFVTEMPAATNVYRMFYGASFDEVRISLPDFADQGQGVIFGNANIRKAVLVAPKWKNMNYLCHGAGIETLEIYAPVASITALGGSNTVYRLRNVKLTSSVLSTADGAFQNAQLTRDSALHILGILPTYTSGEHPLTIGIHIDHQSDTEVLAAIANAEAKGWTLTVQWNGSPTAQAASTYGLRKPPIYVKIGEMKLPDGTTERVLDWGHYVTNPEDYQEFSSLEEAYNYFNLEMPQTEE